MFGLFSHPVKGIGKSIANSFRPELGEIVLEQPRYAMGVQEAQMAERETKQAIIRQFEYLSTTVKERQKALKNEAKRWMREVEMASARSQEVDTAVQQT